MSDFLEMARNLLSPFPIGDPVEFEHYARWLEAQASRYDACARRLIDVIESGGLIADNGNQHWPHLGNLKWPHLMLFV